MLAYAFTCDGRTEEEEEEDTEGLVAQQQQQQQEEQEFHNPSASYSMRIDLVGV
jgi:hypothetical protein